MDLEGTPIEVAIGPYEVYTDRLYGRKTAFERFVTLKDTEESAAPDKYKGYLRDMEATLPNEERYTHYQRGFERPIDVDEKRTEERREGKEGGSTCRYQWSQYT